MVHRFTLITVGCVAVGKVVSSVLIILSGLNKCIVSVLYFLLKYMRTCTYLLYLSKGFESVLSLSSEYIFYASICKSRMWRLYPPLALTVCMYAVCLCWCPHGRRWCRPTTAWRCRRWRRRASPSTWERRSNWCDWRRPVTLHWWDSKLIFLVLVCCFFATPSAFSRHKQTRFIYLLHINASTL